MMNLPPAITIAPALTPTTPTTCGDLQVTTEACLDCACTTNGNVSYTSLSTGCSGEALTADLYALLGVYV